MAISVDVSSVFRITPRLFEPYSPVLQTSFYVVSDFSSTKLLLSLLKTAFSGFCHSISFGVTSFVVFPSLVRLPSSSPVYLSLFLILWVLGDHCLSLLLHFLGWSSIARLLAMWSYCSNFRVIGVCLAEVPPFYHSFDLPYSCPIMRTSSGPNRSSGL